MLRDKFTNRHRGFAYVEMKVGGGADDFGCKSSMVNENE